MAVPPPGAAARALSLLKQTKSSFRKFVRNFHFNLLSNVSIHFGYCAFVVPCQPTTWKQSSVRVWEFDHVIQFVTKKDSFFNVGVLSVDLVFSFV